MANSLEMNVFIKIVETGGISKAADQLGIAKSAVSRRLSELERRLGVQLLNRTTRTSSLTDAGRTYYQRAVTILGDIRELDAEMSSSLSSIEGSIKIAAPYSFGLLQLNPTLSDFAKLHPNVLVNIDFSDRQVDLIEEGYDLAIRIADMKDSSLIARKLAPVEFRLCANSTYLETNGIPKHPNDLKSHAGLHYAYTKGSTWKFEQANGETINVKVPTKMVANNGEFLRDMALAGHGLAVLPLFIADAGIQSGELITLLDDYTLPQLNAYLVYPQTRNLSKRVRSLIDHLIEHQTNSII